MTESIFVPFRLTTREACEKAIKVLTSKPAPKVVSDQPYELATQEEVKAFEERLRKKHEQKLGKKVVAEA